MYWFLGSLLGSMYFRSSISDVSFALTNLSKPQSPINQNYVSSWPVPAACQLLFSVSFEHQISKAVGVPHSRHDHDVLAEYFNQFLNGSPSEDQDLYNIALSMKCFMYLYMDDIKSAWYCLMFSKSNSREDSMFTWLKGHRCQIDELMKEVMKTPYHENDVDKVLRNQAHGMCKELGECLFDDKTPSDILCGLLVNIFDPVDQELKNCSLPVLAAICGMQFLAWSIHGVKYKKGWPKTDLLKVLKTIGAKNTTLLKYIADPPARRIGFPNIPNSSSSKDEWALFIMSYAMTFFNKINGCREYILNYLYPGVKISWDCGHKNY